MKFLKKVLIMVLVTCLSVTMFPINNGCGMQTVQAASKVKLNKSKVTLVPGQKLNLKISGTKAKVKWSSSKKSVATVNSKGQVTAKKKGSSIIVAKIGKKQYRSKITVVNLSAFTINKKSLSLEEGDRYKLKIKYKPSNVKISTKDVKWTSSDEDVAEVNENGYIYAYGEGTATITAKIGNKKATCKVVVTVEEEIPETKYGIVSGNVTYHYNQYRGYVADPKSLVFLIPKDSDLEHVDKNVINKFYNYSLSVLTSNTIDELKKIGIYAVKTDGYGNFTISHVPTGDYLVYIISAETSTGGWFDAYDDSISDATDEYYSEVAGLIKIYVDSDLALLFGKAAAFHAYAYESVTIYEGETSTVTHAFPYTYI